MVGAVQLGMVAASLVLFLPMGMAGWHLSRNKMLFFSAAMFITLAIGVHIMPYLPNFPHILVQSFAPLNPSFYSPSGPAASGDKNSAPCLSALHNLQWRGVNGSGISRDWYWNSHAISGNCKFVKLSRGDALDLLNGTWIVIMGDSESRFLARSLLELLLVSADEIRADLFKRHSNYSSLIQKNGIRIDFVWAPYAVNITKYVLDFRRNGEYPDVVVMGTGLWHMLHANNVSLYGRSLERLQNAVVSILPLKQQQNLLVRAPHMFWLGFPNLVRSMLNTPEKREKMTGAMCAAYASQLRKSKLLRDDGGPLVLLDIHRISAGCGDSCTQDGMHYQDSVYEAAVQIMLNALLIDSRQVPSR